jgi:hypothetical protein
MVLSTSSKCASLWQPTGNGKLGMMYRFTDRQYGIVLQTEKKKMTPDIDCINF